MEFDNLDDVWQFWNEYGRRTGFGVRKEYRNTSKNDKVITSAVYVCSKYGHRREDKRILPDAQKRWKIKSECKVRLLVTLDRKKGKYIVKDFFENHNHSLESQNTVHMLRSYRKVDASHALAIDNAHDLGFTQRSIHDMMSKEAGGREKLGYTKEDQKRYLRSKRERNMEYGELGNILKYFEKQKTKNLSFDYSLQLDEEEMVTNIFWVDDRMKVDYEVFGDVVVFDTTFGTNREGRPLGIFTGFNHHKEMVIFGAALMYDETICSFSWLFETFISVHGGKKPKTFFTDQDAAMASAIQMVLPDTKHGLCLWHIRQNALKHLSSHMKDRSGLLGDFMRCMYDCGDEIHFENEWLNMLEKHSMSDNDWLKRIYTLKEKWAMCFMKHHFTLGMKSTQLSESLNSDMKRLFERKLSIEDFFKVFDKVVEQKRINEMEADFRARQLIPSLVNEYSTLLRQASKMYTPKIFKQFEEEFKLASLVKVCDKDLSQSLQKYIVCLHDSQEKIFIVFCDHNTGIVTCSCKKFESEGILCCHSLKVYIILDIMEIPEKYILSRWTRGIKSGYSSSGEKISDEEDRHIWHKRVNSVFLKLSYQASLDKKTRDYVDKMITTGCKNIFEFTMGKHVAVDNEIESNMHLIVGNMKGLKKKTASKGIKRTKPWHEKYRQKKKKVMYFVEHIVIFMHIYSDFSSLQLLTIFLL